MGRGVREGETARISNLEARSSNVGDGIRNTGDRRWDAVGNFARISRAEVAE